jgi:Rad52/22 family double-strand break repair protein
MEAEKGALSDAFKRAAVRWGVGRYLYEIKSPWITLEKHGRTAVISDEYKTKLDNLYQEHVKRIQPVSIQPVIGVNAYRQAYRLLINSINTVSLADLAAYAKANEATIAGLPAAMRDHVLSTIHKRKAST